jgi:ABC-2 type transport system ATP-binding protein
MSLTFISQQERVNEISLALSNQDLNRVSRRSLDLAYEFDYPEEIKRKALDLRANYNSRKELGKSGNDNVELQDSFSDLLKDLESIELEIKLNGDIEEVICEAKQIGKVYTSIRGSFTLAPIDLTLERGKIVGLVGENGNGKTTLLRVLCGEISSSDGGLNFYEGDRKIDTWEEIKENIAFIPQRTDRWWGTVEEQISFGASIKGIVGEENDEKTNFIIHRLGLTNFRFHSWSQLSSGYKLRVEIAKTLVWEPRVLILDEPLANLDLLAQELLLQDLKDLANSWKQPVSMILTSQQLHEVETIADQIIFLKNGKAIFNGGLDELKNQDEFLTVELNGSFSYDELNLLLASFDIRIEKNASGYTANIPNSKSIKELQLTLINSDFELSYFRNITNSTKKLFSDKY